MTILTDNLSAQRIFDHASLQLALQGGPSRYSSRASSCAYRSKTGRKCGVGFLLTEEEVAVMGNTAGIRSAAEAGHVPERLKPFIDLLARIQGCHDIANNDTDDNWSIVWGRLGIAQQLEVTAEDFNLDKGVLYSAFPREGAPEQRKAPVRDVVDLSKLELELSKPMPPVSAWTKWWDALHPKEGTA